MSVVDLRSKALSSRAPLAPVYRAPPAFVVGLPRSGSSWLASVLSSLDDWFVFDDLYIVRQARARGVRGRCTRDQLRRLVFFLGWQVRARIKHDRDFDRLALCLEEVDQLCDTVENVFRDRPPSWPELLEEWMVRLALIHGRTRWGYKTPQDFLHMAQLFDVFPGARFIFNLRDPRSMLASLKHLEGEDGTRRQYHPLVYSRYWRLAVELVQREAQRLDVPLFVVRLEDASKDPEAIATQLAQFLGASRSEPVPKSRFNTSFRMGARRSITPTEAWLCEKIAGPAMALHGYEPSGASSRLRDLPDLLWTTLRFAIYQSMRLSRDPAARVSVQSLLRGWLGPKRH